jgi:uncharacterized membrane protein (Fun14 family)
MNFKEEISDKQIERSLWFIKNQALIKKIVILILLITIFILYGFSLLKFINIKIQETKQENLEPTMINFQSWYEKNKPRELTIINKSIIPLTNNRYDIVVEMKNPNEKIAITELKYKFVYDNQNSDEKSTFFLPGETKKLVDFGVESNKIIRTFEIEIIETKFNRLKTSEIEQYNKNIFVISNEITHFNNREANARNWIEFTVINESPYNWAETKFLVSLNLGSKLIAINEIKTEKFYAQEEKILKASWFQKIPSYVTLKIEPETNILDPKNYINHR